MDRANCRGCRNNFYNGNNNIDVKECWSLKNAKLVKCIPIGHWESPPYSNKKVVKVLNCWHGEGSNRTHYIPLESINSDGYWK